MSWTQWVGSQSFGSWSARRGARRVTHPRTTAPSLALEPLEARHLLSFLPAVHHGTGLASTSVAVADLNGDQILDLAVSNASSGNVSVLLGNGDGTFQRAVHHAVDRDSLPHSVAVGDFDGDAVPDLAVARYAPDDTGWVSVLLGLGDGSFQAPASYAAGARTTFVTVGELNGDAALDLITANIRGDDVSVLLGNGDGTFQAPVNYPVGRQPFSVAVADFNGDGLADLAVANYNNAEPSHVSVLLGHGDGTFAAAANYASGDGGPIDVAVGDFDGDAIPDLAVTNRSILSNNVSVLRGNGDGSFQDAVNYPTGVAARDVLVDDFNLDGLPDLAVANEHSETVGILLGRGDGAFQPAENFRTGRLPQSMAAGDFNGDGFPDLVTANLRFSETAGASVLLNAADWGGSAPGAGLPADLLRVAALPVPMEFAPRGAAVGLSPDLAAAEDSFTVGPAGDHAPAPAPFRQGADRLAPDSLDELFRADAVWEGAFAISSEA